MNFSLVSFVQMEFHCLPISIIQTIYKEDYRNSRIVKHSLYKYMYILSIERFFETKIAIISNNLLTLDRTMIINIKKYRLFPIITLAKKKKKTSPRIDSTITKDWAEIYFLLLLFHPPFGEEASRGWQTIPRQKVSTPGQIQANLCLGFSALGKLWRRFHRLLELSMKSARSPAINTVSQPLYLSPFYSFIPSSETRSNGTEASRN